MKLLENLNPNQKAAITSLSQQLRIIAGAGSGKTRVLTTKMAYLVQEIGVSPRNILAITFTNKATNEMKQRLYQLLKDGSSGMHISTIHALCVRILREDIVALNYPRNFTVMDQEDQKVIIKKAYKEVGLSNQIYSYYSCLSYISNNKGAGISVSQAIHLAGKAELEVKKALAYQYYEKQLHELMALDFDDLLLVTVKILSGFPERLQKWQYRFNYIHVDEFQDIDQVQYELIKLLVGQSNQFCVVGDPDQTIYSWRGADIKIILNLAKDFPELETIVLNENYRSTQNILSGANSLIENNLNRIAKDLFTKQAAGELIEHFCASSQEHEAFWIGTKIKELGSQGINFRQIAILYRSNYLSRFVEKGLLDLSIPYVIFGGVRFYDRLEVKDALSYLRLISIGDDLAFLRVINAPKRGIGEKTLERIEAEANARQVSLFEAIQQMTFPPKMQAQIEQFVKIILALRAKQHELSVSELLQEVLTQTGYQNILQINQETDRLENLKELMNDMEVFKATHPEGTLNEYLQLVSLYVDTNAEPTGSYVQLMTIHAAKGLEFDYVFVVGMSEGAFPSERTLSEGLGGLEEERRLAYVAFTRARQQLFLTDSSGFNFVLDRPRITSRFIQEVDEAYIKHSGARPDSLGESSFLSSELDLITNGSIQYRPNDRIEHKLFGEGVIIELTDNIAKIAFAFPHGTKKLNIHHQSISKKDD